MIIAYGTGTRLDTMEFLEQLKRDGYKIEWAWNGDEYSKEYFINEAPQYSDYIVVNHEEKTATFWEFIIGMKIFVCNELPKPNPLTRENLENCRKKS